MRATIWTAGLAVILAAGVTSASAQVGSVIRRDVGTPSTRQIEPSSLVFAGPWRPGSASGKTQVIGTVIDIRQVPVSNVRVQLRDLNTGVVIEVTDTNGNGEYEFDLEASGTYVIEMVLADGNVVALSNAGSVSKYETLQTVVQLPGRWDTLAQVVVAPVQAANFVGMSSATTMTAATLTIAVGQSIPPVDPGQDVTTNSVRPQ